MGGDPRAPLDRKVVPPVVHATTNRTYVDLSGPPSRTASWLSDQIGPAGQGEVACTWKVVPRGVDVACYDAEDLT